MLGNNCNPITVNHCKYKYTTMANSARKNPFCLQVLPPESPFCDRERELADLVGYAEAGANVVLFSPRRFGKTSLVRRVQQRLADDGAITVYADFFGVSSLEDVAATLARAVFAVTRKDENLFARAVRTIKAFRPAALFEPNERSGVKVTVQMTSARKSGEDLLEEVMESLGTFIKDSEQLVQISLDEFQEIVKLDKAAKVEAILRRHIQLHGASYFFIGSRRSILLAMFNEKQRPFFRSALNYELAPLPDRELAAFIKELFGAAGKKCSLAMARSIVERVGGFPFYAQKLSFYIFEICQTAVRTTDIDRGFVMLLQDLRYDFEGILMNIAPKQIGLLRALAEEPTEQVFSKDYIYRHRLGSLGAIQTGIRKLKSLDIIEQDEKKIWRLVDPVFCRWVGNKR